MPSPQSKGKITQVREYQEAEIHRRPFQGLPTIPDKKIREKFINMDAKILNEIIAIRSHQCFKIILHFNQIGFVQEYKDNLKLEKKNDNYIIMHFINSIRVEKITK